MIKPHSLFAALFFSLIILLTACGGLDAGPANGPESETSTPEKPAPSDTASAEALAVLELVNSARAQGYDCGSKGDFVPAAPLALESRLGVAAQKHSEDMAAAGEMSHTTPAGAVHHAPGSSPWDRIGAEGYSFRVAGENVAYGFSSAQAVMTAWLESDGHCANIMNPAVTELGVGEADAYWTQVFAAPK